MKQICSIIISVLTLIVVLIGDLVYSYDTITGEVSLQQVTETVALKSKHINYLTIIDENGIEHVIETTDVHPFWVVTDEPDLERAARHVVDENGVTIYHENLDSDLNGFWVEAKDLRVGDVFLGANGELATLTNIVRVEHADGIAVYNFAVAGNNNYFVLSQGEFGQIAILVHNGTYCFPEHHSLPKFLGGLDNQPKITLARDAHVAYHKDLYKTLAKRGLPQANMKATEWEKYMRENAGSQRKAFAAALDSAKTIDKEYGTSIAPHLINNFRNGLYTKYW